MLLIRFFVLFRTSFQEGRVHKVNICLIFSKLLLRLNSAFSLAFHPTCSSYIAFASTHFDTVNWIEHLVFLYISNHLIVDVMTIFSRYFTSFKSSTDPFLVDHFSLLFIFLSRRSEGLFNFWVSFLNLEIGCRRIKSFSMIPLRGSGSARRQHEWLGGGTITVDSTVIKKPVRMSSPSLLNSYWMRLKLEGIPSTKLHAIRNLLFRFSGCYAQRLICSKLKSSLFNLGLFHRVLMALRWHSDTTLIILVGEEGRTSSSHTEISASVSTLLRRFDVICSLMCIVSLTSDRLLHLIWGHLALSYSINSVRR